MRFPPETRLGPYELVAFLGEGGMGEVYRARDTRLDRTVAVKVLSADLAADPEMRQRFDREARAISALSHPNICPLFDVGHAAGVDFLVMEYLVGETLAQRLARGRLTVDQVLKYSIEIADALHTAHRSGIVHRDLKPGNIIITASGAKLLDFGLAKLQPEIRQMAGEAETAPLRNITTAGVIIGTLTYMAPEQLESGTIDARTDIFSFGAVMYEMATGKCAFEGRSQASIIAAVLSTTPPSATALQPAIPVALDRIITTCLAKEPDDRWQTARDLLRELRWIAHTLSSPSNAIVQSGHGKRPWLPWSVAGALAVVLAAFIATTGWYANRAAPAVSPVRFTVSLPEGMTIGHANVASSVEDIAPIVAPDGKQLAIVATDSEGKAQLVVRRFDAVDAVVIDGAEGATRPFWSPDSRFVAFFADGKLRVVDTRGGRPQPIADIAGLVGGTWNADGVIVFAPGTRDGLYRVAATGGTPTKLTSLNTTRREVGHVLPSFLPDGTHFLYLVLSPDPQAQGTYIGSLGNQTSVQLLNGRFKATYAEPGYLVFVRNGTLLAQPFDAQTKQLGSGAPQPIHDPVVAGAFSTSPSGVLAFHPMNNSRSQLMWTERQGVAVGLVQHVVDNHPVALSPDGRRAAVIRNDPQTESQKQDIWLVDLSRDLVSRLTANVADECCPVWSPDGSEIIFGSDRDGPMNLYRTPTTGAGRERLLLKNESSMSPKDWSSDGTQLLVSMRDDLWLLPLQGDLTLQPVVQGPASESDGKLSPDGKWVAYVSNESGRMEVYLAAVGAPGQRWQVSTTGGYQPRWSRDGREVFFVTSDSRLMAVAITTAAEVQVARPRELFRTRLSLPAQSPFVTRYDVAADGRFILNVPIRPAPPLTVVLNWHAALGQPQ